VEKSLGREPVEEKEVRKKKLLLPKINL